MQSEFVCFKYVNTEPICQQTKIWPDGRHLTSSTPMSPFPLVQPNLTFALSVWSLSETLKPFVTMMSGHITCWRGSLEIRESFRFQFQVGKTFKFETVVTNNGRNCWITMQYPLIKKEKLTKKVTIWHQVSTILLSYHLDKKIQLYSKQKWWFKFPTTQLIQNTLRHWCAQMVP
jgi:hypothetical protein